MNEKTDLKRLVSSEFRSEMNFLPTLPFKFIELKLSELLTLLNKEDILVDKSIKVIKTNRGGKITYHGPGQLICYFVIDLKKRKKDIRKFITLIEKTIIDTLNSYNIVTFSDKNNVGIWYNDKSKIKKVAAIGVRVSKWIAYHGFSINVNNNLKKYKAIIPCGIKDKGVTSLKEIYDQNYDILEDKIIENFIPLARSLFLKPCL